MKLLFILLYCLCNYSLLFAQTQAGNEKQSSSAKPKMIYALDSLNQLMNDLDLDLIWLGEFHGSQEIATLTRQIQSQSKKPVKIIVEWNRNFQPCVDAFSQEQDCHSLSCLDTVWHDGRYSNAMVDIIRIGAERKTPAICMDYDLNFPGDSDLRDSLMAELVARHIGKDTLLIVISGNLHAIAFAELAPASLPQPAYAQLRKRLGDKFSMLSLSVFFGQGILWNCTSKGCGPHKQEDQRGMEKSLNQKGPFVYFTGSQQVSTGFQWNGFIYLEKATASSPFNKQDCQQ